MSNDVDPFANDLGLGLNTELDLFIHNAVLALIGDIVVDCVLSESHSYESEVTEDPVESGGTISDNVRNNPIEVTMECLVTNAPLDGPPADGSSPSFTTLARLLKIRADREPIPISTSLRTYENMVMRSLVVTRNTEDALRFTAVFRELEIVSIKRTPRVAIPIAGGGKKFTKTPVPASIGPYILVNKYNKTWWDPDIAGWRDTAWPIWRQLDAGVLTGRVYEGKWLITKGRPEHFSVVKWETKHPDDEEVRFINEGLAKQPPEYSPYIVMLGPGEYVKQFPEAHSHPVRR